MNWGPLYGGVAYRSYHADYYSYPGRASSASVPADLSPADQEYFSAAICAHGNGHLLSGGSRVLTLGGVSDQGYNRSWLQFLNSLEFNLNGGRLLADGKQMPADHDEALIRFREGDCTRLLIQRQDHFLKAAAAIQTILGQGSQIETTQLRFPPIVHRGI